MAPFHYSGGDYFCEQTKLEEVARAAGTPCYVYSAAAILEAYRSYDEALGDLPSMVCYAVKANSNLAVLSLLADAGAGFDIVSAGELFRVLKAGGDAGRVVFSGVGKTAREMEYALESRIHSFNCESESELELLDEVAARVGVEARFSLRLNPNVNAVTHPYIATGLMDHKFGIGMEMAESLYDRSRKLKNLRAEGVSCHIGSQILEPSPMIEAAETVLALARRLRAIGFPLRHVDIGGGLGIPYHAGEQGPGAEQLLASLREPLRASGLSVFVEPGRSIAGPAGVLLTQVLYRKRNGAKEFVIVDAAMNDLIRPALYQSHHEIVPLRESAAFTTVDVVGPVCESGDFLARHRALAGGEAGGFLAVGSAGAYGFAQSSNYNSRPRAAEVLVTGGEWRIVRERETLEDLIRGEHVWGEQV